MDCSCHLMPRRHAGLWIINLWTISLFFDLAAANCCFLYPLAQACAHTEPSTCHTLVPSCRPPTQHSPSTIGPSEMIHLTSVFPNCAVIVSISLWIKGVSNERWSKSDFGHVKQVSSCQEVAFSAPVLAWAFRLWVSASVKHLETIPIVKGAK